MGIVQPQHLGVVDQPELVIGLAAPVGTPIEHVQRVLREVLEAGEYKVEDIRLTKLMEVVEEDGGDGDTPDNEYERIGSLMDRGNALRSRMGGGEVLAVLATMDIFTRRPQGEETPALDGHAFILRQLKHPDEVDLLRRVYGEAFHLIGIHCPESTRLQSLTVNQGMSERQARDLIKRDEGEESELGQQLRDTFHLADVIVPLPDARNADRARAEIERYLALLFGDLSDGICSPTADEYGMYMAYSASLRSADLSRQVGAAILTEERELAAVGCNDVPSAGGGQYWCDNPDDARDFRLGYDSNARKKLEILKEVLSALDPDFADLDEDQRAERMQEVSEKLGPARLMNLTEFGRAVHAEMEAILTAGRLRTSVVKGDLYTTTFPCHNCAKHIVGAGLKRIVYVEPYPKSLAVELHNDSIHLNDEGDEVDDGWVSLESFVGVAPRRFASLFGMVSSEGKKYRRKDAEGSVLAHVAGLRTPGPILNYMERERVVAAALSSFLEGEHQQELDLG